jgi:hypothetical protein
MGSLYTNLSTRTTAKVLYGQVFYIKRALIATVLAFQVTYGIQFGLIQIALLTNTIYLLYVHPYNYIDESHSDCLNEIGLLLL